MNNGVGFDLISLGCGAACILYSPLLALLKYVQKQDEEKVIFIVFRENVFKLQTTNSLYAEYS